MDYLKKSSEKYYIDKEIKDIFEKLNGIYISSNVIN